MNKLFLIGLTSLLPSAIFAEINVNLSINSGSNRTATKIVREVEYIDYGDPWFDGHICEGPSRISFEYQWSRYGADYVLRYRKITFNTINSAWFFGTWKVKEVNRRPVNRVHIKHVSHPEWRRVYNRRTRTYFYEYRNHEHHNRRRAKVYRYEYRPHHGRAYHHSSHIKKSHGNKHVYKHKSSKSDNDMFIKRRTKKHAPAKLNNRHPGKNRNNYKTSTGRVTKISGRN